MLQMLAQRVSQDTVQKVIMHDKICKVCGESFQTADTRRKYCSDKCFKEHERERLAIFNRTSIGKFKRKQYRKEHYTPVGKCCVECGDPLTDGRQSYCLDCLLRDYLYNNTATTRQRLYNRGYDTEMILTEIEERGIV